MKKLLSYTLLFSVFNAFNAYADICRANYDGLPFSYVTYTPYEELGQKITCYYKKPYQRFPYPVASYTLNGPFQLLGDYWEIAVRKYQNSNCYMSHTLCVFKGYS